MKRKIALVCMAALTGTMLITACGSNETGKNVTASDGKAKVRFATWDVADDLDAQQKLVDKFNEEHDDIEVTLEAYGSDYDTKISAGMGSGDTPDVMYMWNYPAYADGLEPLDEYIESEGNDFKENIYSTLWNYNSLDGTTYGMPVGFTTHALYFNKDLFEEAGVEEPTDDWTWEDLKSAAKKIEEKTGQKGFAFQMKPDPYDFEMYLWSNGTSYCDTEGMMAGNIDSDNSQEVFQMFQDMEKDGYAIATEKNGTDEFRAGTVAMYVYGSWAINTLDNDGMNYGIVKIPTFDGQTSVSILSSSGLSISKDSKNKDAAWEFVKYWTGEECNKARIGMELPVLNSVVESEGIMNEDKFAPFYKMLEQSDGHTPASFIIEDWSEISEILSLSFEQLFNPSAYMDVKEVLKEAAEAQ